MHQNASIVTCFQKVPGYAPDDNSQWNFQYGNKKLLNSRAFTIVINIKIISLNSILLIYSHYEIYGVISYQHYDQARVQEFATGVTFLPQHHCVVCVATDIHVRPLSSTHTTINPIQRLGS